MYQSWQNNTGSQIAFIGYGSSANDNFSVSNSIGDVNIASSGGVSKLDGFNAGVMAKVMAYNNGLGGF